MDNTNSRTFRTKLSEFFDVAVKKPVAIARGGDRFVLMNENEYLNLKDEVLLLQRNLISMLEVRSGKSETFTDSEKQFSEDFDNISAKVKKKHKVKKTAGE
jgi:PHD/YefM family antitoxin component YafN of YafNO toxin-antitoxin module